MTPWSSSPLHWAGLRRCRIASVLDKRLEHSVSYRTHTASGSSSADGDEVIVLLEVVDLLVREAKSGPHGVK